ncbi:hypothetical protein CDD82_5823 [Ophiocordyceps australis]|uniref:Glycosyltransferase family 31 protein n=1 Tax=Ophiocordyceps australis TaxID=1399860 RepID=A0A2C5ZN27_9HYPO|nr:hypothetical protein CDD82_5823 [Ophiocordyceps australis]
MSARRMRLSNAVLGVLLTVLLVHTLVYWQPQKQHVAALVLDWAAGPAGDGVAEEAYLDKLVQHYGLTQQTQWRALRVRQSAWTESESPLTDVGVDFGNLPGSLVDLTAQAANRSDLLRASHRLGLPVRRGRRVADADPSHFLFSLSTTYERIATHNWALLHSWQRWLTRPDGHGRHTNGAAFVLMLDKATDEQLRVADQRLMAAGIEAYVVATNDAMSMATRYHELARIAKAYAATLAASGQLKRWYAFVDDAVFFPSLTLLAERLAAYDANELIFVGLPSERADWYPQGHDNTMTTHGGGAVVVSRSALAAIAHSPCLETSVKGPPPVRPRSWDAQLSDCARHRSGMAMHMLPGLYSPHHDDDHDHDHDAHAEHDGKARQVSSSEETGVRPLVLHDFRSRHGVDPVMAHTVADACGDACFMQRYLFRDNWILINGVSISHHPDGLDRRPPKPSLPNQAPPLRQKRVSPDIIVNDAANADIAQYRLISKGRRHVWTLLDSSTDAVDGSVWQAYVKRASNDPESAGMDSVIVLVWENAVPR